MNNMSDMLDKMKEMLGEETTQVATLDHALEIAISALEEIAVYAVYSQPAQCEYEAKKALDALRTIKELHIKNSQKDESAEP
jgi:hypothetical protein